MHPQIRLPAPGNCPICGMKLIPVSQLLKAKADMENRAGIENESVLRRNLYKEIRTVGKLDYSERQVEVIASRIAGRVDRVFADFTGLDVNQGDHLVAIYSPELYSAQNELLTVLAARDRERPLSANSPSFSDVGLESSRTKLRLLGILDEQIREIETTKKLAVDLTIFAPLGGTVIEKNVRVGQYVAAGDPLYRIANLDPIWLYLNIYEYDIAWVRFGQTVEIALEAFPGEKFHGLVTFVDPFLDDATRSIRVRVNLKNAERRLKPQMYAMATIRVPLRADGSPEPTGWEGHYICPMHPETVQPSPGTCKICNMPLRLIPKHPSVVPTATAVPQAQMPPVTPAQEHIDPVEDPSRVPGELAIPVSAVLDTGRRRIAYRLTKDQAYELVELKLGARAQATDEQGRVRDFYLVLGGINAGEQVVTQSGFLLDSQRQIEGMPSLLYPSGQAASMTGHAGHGGHAAPAPTATPPSPAVAPMPAGHKH